MKISYVDKTFREDSLRNIYQANEIIEEYMADGYDLTLRQLYYQFVARGYISNDVKSYSRLASIISNARMAGLIDWDAIVDRTRNLKSRGHWTEPSEVIRAARNSFFMSRWANQRHRVEVWVEKDALVGVIEKACHPLDVPFFSCRGYVSQSEMWSAANRLKCYGTEGQEPVILHLGDHDPSGIDMSRDIEERLRTFHCEDLTVRRIALTMKQVREVDPPPNPAKITDSRANDYIAKYGNESWELDALNPRYLINLITTTVQEYIDPFKLDVVKREEGEHLRTIDAIIESIKP